MLFKVLLCSCEHIFLDLIEELTDFCRYFWDSALNLFSCISSYKYALACLEILRSNLDTYRDSSHLLLCELESGCSVCIVCLYSVIWKTLCDIVSCVKNALFLLLDRNNNNLDRSDLRRNNESWVVAVYHDHSSDSTCCKSPWSLIYIVKFVVFARILDLECLGKSITEVVAGCALKSSSVVHKCLNCVCSLSSCKLFFICLLSLDNRDSHIVLKEVSIYVKHLLCTLFCFFKCSVCCVAFLPEEFSASKERSCLFFPTNNAAPLVEYLREVFVWVDLSSVIVTEKCLWCRTYTVSLCKRLESAVCYPRNFRCETFYVVLLLLKKWFRDKHGKVCVLNSCCLESCVKVFLNELPDCISRRFDHHTSLNIGITYEIGFDAHIGIPLCEIFIHRCDLWYEFLVVSHVFSPFLQLSVSGNFERLFSKRKEPSNPLTGTEDSRRYHPI